MPYISNFFQKMLLTWLRKITKLLVSSFYSLKNFEIFLHEATFTERRFCSYSNLQKKIVFTLIKIRTYTC